MLKLTTKIVQIKTNIYILIKKKARIVDKCSQKGIISHDHPTSDSHHLEN